MGPKTLILIRLLETGWNQCHCKDYQILIPTTIHGSKSELERSRCHENRDNALIDAPLTSESHHFWSNCSIFKIHTFSETGSQDHSKHVKINLIGEGLRLKGRRLEICTETVKSPNTLQTRGGSFFFPDFFSLPCFSARFPPLVNTKNTQKNTSKFLHSSLFTKNTKYCSYTQSSFPWFYTLDLGFRGVDLAF